MPVTANESTSRDQWLSLIERASANAENEPTLTPLPSMKVLRIEGEDTDSFLQSQLSADLRTLTQDNWIRASYCSPKGRVLAVMTLWRKKNAILTALPTEIIGTILQRLSLYKLRSRVELSVAGDLLLAGAGQAAWPHRFAEQALFAPEPGQVSTTNALGMDLLALSQHRVLLCASAPAFEKIAPSIQSDLSETDWWAGCISDQEAQVFAATQEHFVPQMLNLDISGAVSFRKGCYPGQEVVARMHYLGKARQRMLKASYAPTETTTTQAAPGQTVRDSNGKRLGEVVMAHPGLTDLLISVRTDLVAADVVLEAEDAVHPLELDQEALERWQNEATSG